MISTSGSRPDNAEDIAALEDPAGPPYALFLRLSGRRCLVVGGGDVASRKCAVLLEAGARVVIVAPELGADLAAATAVAGRDAADPLPGDEGPGALTWVPRTFEEDDLQGSFLVIAATDDPEVNRRVARAARGCGALVNVVDDPALCDFFVPAVMRRGSLQVAVSTGGIAPGLSRRIRLRLEEEFSTEWERAVRAVGAGRAALLGMRELDTETRRSALRALASLDIAGLLDKGGAPAVEAAVDASIEEAAALCTSRPSE